MTSSIPFPEFFRLECDFRNPMKLNRSWCCLWVAGALALTAHAAPQVKIPEKLDLSGEWRFELDRTESGVKERWHERRLHSLIQLPGALQNQGFGDQIGVETKWTANVNDRSWYTDERYARYRQDGNVKIPFWLQPQRHYVGLAWYQRDIEIPPAWNGRRIVLTFERSHWGTRLWVDGREIGSQESLSAPHRYDLGTGLAPGKHQVTVQVDNRLLVDVGVWAHSVSDHTQGNWNGLVGKIELSTTTPVWIDNVQAFPDVASRAVRLKVRIGNSTKQPGEGKLKVGKQIYPVTWQAGGGQAEVRVELGSKAALWDEFHPNLNRLKVELLGDLADDACEVQFGLRDFGVQGRQFTMNGRKTFLRGTLECCIFPLTGYPPTDLDSWKRIVRICKAHGLNHIRFHSWCPPEAAFQAADELGFYYQVEIAAWATVGDGGPVDDWLYREADRIVEAYGNHPSFMLMPYGNEPAGSKQNEYLTRWVNHWKAKDPRRLYTTAAGWPTLDVSEYQIYQPPRGVKGWGGLDYRKDVEKLAVPVVVHEMGQWCVYPNFDEMAKYTGPLKPKNFEIFMDSLTQKGMLPQWKDFLRASGSLQAICYKEEVEAALRTPGVSGVQLLDLRDFPGQGTALVGVLDPFWDSKGYVTPSQFRRFFGATVPLARMGRPTWLKGERMTVPVEIAHFGERSLERCTVYWKVVDERAKNVLQGEFPKRTLPVEQGIQIGEINLDLAGLHAPAAYRLVVGIRGTKVENDWGFWVYPRPTPASENSVQYVTCLDDETLKALEGGATVFLATDKVGRGNPRGSWTPVFWNRQWFPQQECQTLGLLCRPEHPALAGFPTAFHSDWQWNEIVRHSRAVVLDSLPAGVQPIVQLIDDWNTNRKLGLVFECRVGQGRLLVCSADLDFDLEKRPAARQLRVALENYAASRSFQPSVVVEPDALRALLRESKPGLLRQLGAEVIQFSSEDAEHGNFARRAIDGDPDTIWHTKWGTTPDPMPHFLIIDLKKETLLRGVRYWPRRDMNHGRIRGCEVSLSASPTEWGAPAGKATLPNSDEVQDIVFPGSERGRYLRLLVTSEVDGNPFAAIADLDLLP